MDTSADSLFFSAKRGPSQVDPPVPLPVTVPVEVSVEESQGSDEEKYYYTNT